MAEPDAIPTKSVSRLDFVNWRTNSNRKWLHCKCFKLYTIVIVLLCGLTDVMMCDWYSYFCDTFSVLFHRVMVAGRLSIYKGDGAVYLKVFHSFLE